MKLPVPAGRLDFKQAFAVEGAGEEFHLPGGAERNFGLSAAHEQRCRTVTLQNGHRGVGEFHPGILQTGQVQNQDASAFGERFSVPGGDENRREGVLARYFKMSCSPRMAGIISIPSFEE